MDEIQKRPIKGRRQAPRRQFVSWEPCGPVSSILQCELRGKGRGARTRLIEHCIIHTLCMKYPKLAERYSVLVGERAA